jgi:hypothetical protein
LQGELVRSGAIDNFELVFTVQADNYREMGDAVDLAREVGATSMYFGMLTNWGTFTPDQYRGKAFSIGSTRNTQTSSRLCRIHGYSGRKSFSVTCANS